MLFLSKEYAGSVEASLGVALEACFWFLGAIVQRAKGKNDEGQRRGKIAKRAKRKKEREGKRRQRELCLANYHQKA